MGMPRSTAGTHGIGFAGFGEQLVDPDGTRRANYAAAWSFVGGDQWDRRPRPGEPRGRITANYARALVRKTASYVFPDAYSHSVPVGELPGQARTDRAATTVEQLLNAVVRDLDLVTLDAALEYDAAVSGDAAMKVTWDVSAGRPSVVAVDPAQLTVTWSPTDPTTAVMVEHVYGLPRWAAAAALNVTLDDDTALSDQIVRVREAWTSTRWVIQVGEVDAIEQPNPYGWVPYLVVANERPARSFWGVSDLADLYPVFRELNQRLTVLGRILDLSGAPIAVLENVDGSEGIAVTAGAKWELPEGSKAYLLDLLAGGGVTLHLDAIKQVYQVMHDLTETPRTAFGDSGRELSGTALEVEIQPLVQRVARKRRNWSRTHRARGRMLLDLLARFGGHAALIGDVRLTDTVWPSVLPSDAMTDAQVQTLLVSSGIRSARSAMAQLGDTDPEGEWLRVIEERTAAAALAAEVAGEREGTGEDDNGDDRGAADPGAPVAKRGEGDGDGGDPD